MRLIFYIFLIIQLQNILGVLGQKEREQSSQLNSIKSDTIASTSGANALKIDTDEYKNSETEMFNSMVDENMAVNEVNLDKALNENHNTASSDEEIPLNLEETSETTQDTNHIENSNGLENFELSEESPQLFNSGSEIISEKNDKDAEPETEEDELEIPAFLRRQRN